MFCQITEDVLSKLQEYHHAWYRVDTVYDSFSERSERKMSMNKAFNLMKLLKKQVDAEGADDNVQ
jgi:hypothetical protein